jgi:hypothetical protein
MGPAMTKTPNTGMRIWEKKLAGDILVGTASSGECIQYYIGFAQDTMILPRARLRVVRVLSLWSYSTKEEQGWMRVPQDDHETGTTGPFRETSYSSNSSKPV